MEFLHWWSKLVTPGPLLMRFFEHGKKVRNNKEIKKIEALKKVNIGYNQTKNGDNFRNSK